MYDFFACIHTGCPGTVVTHGCWLPCSCYGSITGPLKEQKVFLTVEPFLKLPKVCPLYFKKKDK